MASATTHLSGVRFPCVPDSGSLVQLSEDGLSADVCTASCSGMVVRRLLAKFEERKKSVIRCVARKAEVGAQGSFLEA